MSTNEAILAAARNSAQLHGYAGLNFRDLADKVGIKAASIYHHYPSKADLAVAVAKRYWEDAVVDLRSISETSPGPKEALRDYPFLFRRSLEHENRLCLGSFMSAEYDDLPEVVRSEIQTFGDVSVAWLREELVAAGLASPAESEQRARSIFAAVVGAQLLARSRSDLALFDELIASYRSVGLLP